jgi:hypothetical protein
MVHPTQLTTNKGKEMLDIMLDIDVIWTLILLFIGGSSVVVIGAVSIWIADASYRRKMRKEKNNG